MALATHLGPTVAVTTVATLLAVAAGNPAGRAVLVCVAVLAGQASIGWSNDWLDADRDRAVQRADKTVGQGAVGAPVWRDAARAGAARRANKPVVQGAVEPAVLRAGALTAALLAVVLSLVLGWVP